MLEKMVVLFAKSGRGKSSLINAALTPLFEENTSDHTRYIPVEIRLCNVQGDNRTPLRRILDKLNEVVPLPQEESLIDKMIAAGLAENETQPYSYKLWPYLKKLQLTQKKKVLLIFDQFEEFFSRSAKDQETFRWELSELLYTQVPQFMRDKIETLSFEEYEQFSTNIDVKVLFSIRSDRLSHMHSMNDALPNILQNRFEIGSLNIQQATEAIVNPALIEDDRFLVHPFRYDSEALNTILTELSKKDQDYNSENIETFHLQIICQACEAKIAEKLQRGEKDDEINVKDLPGFSNLYGDYYKRQIEKLPGQLQPVAEELLEEELIYGSHSHGGYRRLSVDKNILLEKLNQNKAPADLLDRLEDIFLIRREPNTVGGYSYEIAHDTILEPIIENKEKKQQEAADRKMAEIILSKKKIETERIFGRSVLGLLTAAIIFFVFYFNWENIYLGYYSRSSVGNRPVIQKAEGLKRINSGLKEDLIAAAREINKNTNINSWEASQIVLALFDGPGDDPTIPSGIKEQYYQLTNQTLRSENCCWREIVNIDDVRASAWVISASGLVGVSNRYKCNVINFLLNNQQATGAWAMIKFPDPVEDYSSTYSTCHVIRALHNSLPQADDSTKQKINLAISKGVQWLMQNITDSTRMIWADYASDENFENTISKSLSGLVMHILNMTGNATPLMNKKWLAGLNNKDALLDITFKEKSDKDHKRRNGEIEFRDGTRHLSLPWQIIATVDAYKDGGYRERFHANKWLNNVVKSLNANDLKKVPRFVKAEIAMALKYVGDNEFVFK